jgi:plasmid stability protein
VSSQIAETTVYGYHILSIGNHMPALYVENVPDDLYKALRKRAKENRKSIAAEVISLLECNIPTSKELQRRRAFYERMAELRASEPGNSSSSPTVEEMIREDRER